MENREDWITWITNNRLRANVALSCLLLGLCGFLALGSVGLALFSEAFPLLTATPTPTLTATITSTNTPTITPTPTNTPTPTFLPVQTFVTLRTLNWFYTPGEPACEEFKLSRRELPQFAQLESTGRNKYCAEMGHLFELIVPQGLEAAGETIWISTVSLMTLESFEAMPSRTPTRTPSPTPTETPELTPTR